MPSHDESRVPPEHSEERPALRLAGAHASEGGSVPREGAERRGPVVIDPKLGDGDDVTRGKLKGMLEDPGVVAAMSRAARPERKDGSGPSGSPRKPYFLNTQQFRDACELAGVGPDGSGGAAGPPAPQPEEQRSSPAVASAWQGQDTPGPAPEDLPSSLAPPSGGKRRAASEVADEPRAAQAKRRAPLGRLALALVAAGLVAAIVVLSWPSEPGAGPVRVDSPALSAAELDASGSTAPTAPSATPEPGSAGTPTSRAPSPTGTSAAPEATHSARAPGAGSAARSAPPSTSTAAPAPSPTTPPGSTPSLPFPVEGN